MVQSAEECGRLQGEVTLDTLVEAASAGFYESKDFPGHFRRHQTLRAAELFESRKIQSPEHGVGTFAEAERKTRPQQEELILAN